MFAHGVQIFAPTTHATHARKLATRLAIMLIEFMSICCRLGVGCAL